MTPCETSTVAVGHYSSHSPHLTQTELRTSGGEKAAEVGLEADSGNKCFSAFSSEITLL